MGCQRLNNRLRGSGRGILLSKGVGIRERFGLLGNLVSLPHHGVGSYLRFYILHLRRHIFTNVVPLQALIVETLFEDVCLLLFMNDNDRLYALLDKLTSRFLITLLVQINPLAS